MIKPVLMLLLLMLSGLASSSDLNRQLETLRQEHLDALQLTLNFPDRGRRAHAKVASQLQSLVGEERIDQGVLAYNIGNSWFHAGRFGESILWYFAGGRKRVIPEINCNRIWIMYAVKGSITYRTCLDQSG